jgi:hypothetical protein
MKLDQAFIDDCPYAPDALFLDEVLELDREASRVVATMNVHEHLPLTRSQRVHPLKHPRHVSGGLMVHVTGMLGFLHAYYVFDLRHADGWIGYGAKIHGVRYHALAKMGEPLLLTAQTTRVRKGTRNIVARYTFTFKQGDAVVYEGDQTAMWLQIDESGAPPLGMGGF